MNIEEICKEMYDVRHELGPSIKGVSQIYEKFQRTDGTELDENTIYNVNISTPWNPTDDVNIIVDYQGNEGIVEEFVYTRHNAEQTAEKEKKFLAEQEILDD